LSAEAADLSGYPELAVIYLGMKVTRLAAVEALLGLGIRIGCTAAARTRSSAGEPPYPADPPMRVC
jgi:hypothetical protein